MLRIALGLRELGHDVVVACRSGTDVEAELRRLGIRTSGARPRGDADVFSALAFAWWLRNEKPDAVLLTSWKRAFVAGWAARVARVPRVVLRVGGVHQIAPGRGSLLRYALRNWYDRIIANSPGVATRMFGGLEGIEGKVDVVVNGIEPSDVQAESASPAAVRAELGIADGDRLIIVVGGMEPNKGFHLLIEALPHLDRAHIALAGTGSPEQRASLETLAGADGVARRVHLLGQRQDIGALLNASDVYVMCSKNEGFPNVATLEAMRAGVPAIVTDVAGAQEAFAPRDGGTTSAGVIIPTDDSQALAEALRGVFAELDSDGAAISARIAESKWRVENWFTLDAMINGYERVLTNKTDVNDETAPPPSTRRAQP